MFRITETSGEETFINNVKTDKYEHTDIKQLKQLRLHGVHRAFSKTLQATSIDYTNDELIAYLLQCEWDDR